MMKQFLFLSAVLFSLTAAAAVKCDSSVMTADSIYKIPGAGYWMQAFGDCRLTYTGTTGTKSAMYNMCTRSSEKITNEIDAFGLPEGDIYLQPAGPGLSFYSMDDLAKNGVTTKPLFSDFRHLGNYQSLGVLSKKENERKIRVVIADDAVKFKDYTIRKKNNTYEIKPDQIFAQPLCKNILSNGLMLQLPTVSRDGQMFAARQTGSDEMNIYKIDSATNTCTVISKVPMIVSKVTFTFDNKSLLYVVTDPVTYRGRLFQMDIATGKIKTLSGPQENVHNVTAKNTGEIFYSRQDESGDENFSTLVKLKSNSFADDKDEKLHKAIGLLWAKSCGLKVDLDSAAAVGQRISGDACRNVIMDGNLELLTGDQKGLTKDLLKMACSSVVSSGGIDPARVSQ